MQMFSTVLFNLSQRVAAIFKICESLLQQKLCVIFWPHYTEWELRLRETRQCCYCNYSLLCGPTVCYYWRTVALCPDLYILYTFENVFGGTLSL